MKKLEGFLFGATFGVLVGLVAGVVGSVGLGIISAERHYPPRYVWYKDKPKYTDKYYDKENQYGYMD